MSSKEGISGNAGLWGYGMAVQSSKERYVGVRHGSATQEREKAVGHKRCVGTVE